VVCQTKATLLLGKKPLLSIGRLGEPQRWSKYFGKDKNLSLPAIES